MKSVKFSVVMPVYNSEKFLLEALDSVAKQTFRNFELVIVNNGSLDGSQDIIDKFIADNPKTTVKEIRLNPNMGISYARNTGAESSNGDYIAFLDSDDYWYPAKLEKLNQALAENSDIDVIWHWENHFSSKKNLVAKYRRVDNDHPYEDLLFNGNTLSPSATAVRKDVFTHAKGFDRKYVNGEEDYDLWLRLAREKSKFYLIEESLGVFRIHDGSTSSKVKIHNEAVVKMLEEHFNWMDSHNLYSKKYLERKYQDRKAEFDFAYGHLLSQNNKKNEAFKYYVKSIEQRYSWWKPYVGILLIPFRK